MKNYRIKQVFVAGGMPSLTFVDRKISDKRKEILNSIDSCKLITVTGNTKTGKTVLINKLFPKDENIWIDGGVISTENDFWEDIVSKMELYEQASIEDEENFEVDVESKLTGGVNAIVAKGEVEFGGKVAAGTKKTNQRTRNLSHKITAINGLKKNKPVLIIDDFHYIKRDIQKNIVRALKSPIFEGLNVICIAIPHRKFDPVMVEKEMTARLINVDIPQWTEDELVEIGYKGEKPLNLKFKKNIISKLASEAFGSPHLMQDFLIELLMQNKIEETQKKETEVSKFDTKMFNNIASNTGKEIFKKLTEGPRARTDRKKRTLKSGDTVDIYKLVLLALVEIKPGLVSINYVPDIRNALKNIIDQLPQVNEISRVFEKMKEIALKDDSSVAVLDWDKTERKLSITDPFFAFYLKYGTIE